MSRDEEQARKFAVEWSTKSSGKIANLAGCYIRACDDLRRLRRVCGDLVSHWDAVHPGEADSDGLWRGIEELRELLKEPT